PPAGVLFAALELLERGEQRPGPIILDAEHAGAGTLGCLEAEDGLDALFSSARHGPRRGAVGVDAEAMGACPLQRSDERLPAAGCPDPPGEGEDVAPMAIGMEQPAQRRILVSREGALEFRQPVADAGRELEIGHGELIYYEP